MVFTLKEFASIDLIIGKKDPFCQSSSNFHFSAVLTHFLIQAFRMEDFAFSPDTFCYVMRTREKKEKRKKKLVFDGSVTS